MSSKKTYPFKEAVIYPKDRDMNKRWFVKYYVWDMAVGDLVSQKVSGRINYIKNKGERLKAAHELKNGINEMLEGGYVLNAEKAPKKAFSLWDLPIEEAIKKVYNIKAAQTKKSNSKGYKTILTHFPPWLKEKGYGDLHLNEMTKDIMISFLDHLIIEKKRSNRTYNNWLTYFNSLFNELKSRDKSIFEEIPTEGIKPLPTVSNKHTAYTPEQMQEVKKVCLKYGYKRLWLFIQFIYYTLARPNEIRNIKVQHVNQEKNLIFIPGENSKNSDGDYIDLYPPLKEAIIQAGLLNNPSNYYLFGQLTGKPGPLPGSHSLFYDKHTKILKETGIKFLDRKYDMYGYKHTGAINLYESGVDLLEIMKQCRHKSPNQTLIYLRDLGLMRNQEHFKNIQAL